MGILVIRHSCEKSSVRAQEGTHKCLERGLEETGNQRKNRPYPNYSIVENGKNTETSYGDLGKLVVIRTPSERSTANTGEKTHEQWKIIIIIIIITMQNCIFCCPGGPENKYEGKWKEG